VTGVGLGAFPVAEGTLSPLAQRQAWGEGVKWSVAHNSFVQVGAELGVAGLLVFVALLITSFVTAMRSAGLARTTSDVRAESLARALAVSLVGYAVAGFFLSQAYAAFLFVLVGLILGLARVLKAPGPDILPEQQAPEAGYDDLAVAPYWATLHDAP
jgi:O-antigen ligase